MIWHDDEDDDKNDSDDDDDDVDDEDDISEGAVDMTNAPVYTARKIRTEILSLAILRHHLSLSLCRRSFQNVPECKDDERWPALKIEKILMHTTSHIINTSQDSKASPKFSYLLEVLHVLYKSSYAQFLRFACMKRFFIWIMLLLFYILPTKSTWKRAINLPNVSAITRYVPQKWNMS